MYDYGVLTKKEEIVSMLPEYYKSPKEEGEFDFDLDFRTWHPYGRKALICYGYDCDNDRNIKLFVWGKVVNGEMVFTPKKSDLDLLKVKDGSSLRVKFGRSSRGKVQWETAELI